MAGMLGIPIGTIGTRPGTTDFNPYLRMRQLQIQAEEQALAQAQQQGQFDATMGQREQEMLAQQQGQAAELQFRAEESDRAASRFAHDFTLREDQQAQQAEMQRAELDLRAADQESLAKSREDRTAQDKTEFDAKQAKEKGAAEEDENLADLYSQTRSIIGQRVGQINASGQMAPEAVRDALLAELDSVDVSGQEKVAMQKAVDEWYKAAVQQKKDDLAAQREERLAESERADLDIKARQIESYDHAKKLERAHKAAIPFRKQQEAVVRQMTDLQNKLAMVDAQLAGASPSTKPFYDNMRLGMVNALDRMKAQYDELETKASTKEAEILAGS